MQTAVGRISAFMNPATFVLINLAIIALIYIGALRVDSGAISRGAVVALYNYMSQILVELIKLANLIISVTKAIACGNRIQSVLDIEPATVPGTVTEGDKNANTPLSLTGRVSPTTGARSPCTILTSKSRAAAR